MFYADNAGLPVVLARVQAYRREPGSRWRPAPPRTTPHESRGFHGDPS
jgi:hypothetical protein